MTAIQHATPIESISSSNPALSIRQKKNSNRYLVNATISYGPVGVSQSVIPLLGHSIASVRENRDPNDNITDYVVTTPDDKTTIEYTNKHAAELELLDELERILSNLETDLVRGLLPESLHPQTITAVVEMYDRPNMLLEELHADPQSVHRTLDSKFPDNHTPNAFTIDELIQNNRFSAEDKLSVVVVCPECELKTKHLFESRRSERERESRVWCPTCRNTHIPTTHIINTDE